MLSDDVADCIDAHEYPATTGELIDAHGDRSIELPDGSETLGAVLSRTGPEVMETPEDARLAVYSAVSDAAVGRTGYSDRDPDPPGSRYGHEVVSF